MRLTLDGETANLIIPATDDQNMRRKYAEPTIVGEIIVTQVGEQKLTLAPAENGFTPMNMGEMTILPLGNAIQGLMVILACMR